MMREGKEKKPSIRLSSLLGLCAPLSVAWALPGNYSSVCLFGSQNQTLCFRCTVSARYVTSVFIFETYRPPHHHSLFLLPLYVFCHHTLLHRLKLRNLLASFFRPADSTEAAETLGGGEGWTEVDGRRQNKGAVLFFLCACARVFDRNRSQVRQLKGVRAEREGGGGREDEDDDEGE